MGYKREVKMNKVPAVSIVVPVYRGGSYLYRIVESCRRLRSVHSNLACELIFVCDDPVDDSSEKAFSLQCSEPWIRVVNLAANSGQHVATAAGLLYSSGDWVLSLDEDLQFNPEESPYMLRQALRDGLDLVYARNKDSQRGPHSTIRNFFSSASKLLMGFITRDDYTSISSFRLIRSEIAQSIAFTIDNHSFLDASLFSVTSERRRGVYTTKLIDTRPRNASGYSFRRLLRHYVRFISSANISSFSLLVVVFSISTLAVFSGVVAQLLIGIAGGSQSIAPGWASQIGITSTLFGLAFGYLTGCIKLLSILVQRSSGMPNFTPVDRSKDSEQLKELAALLQN